MAVQEVCLNNLEARYASSSDTGDHNMAANTSIHTPAHRETEVIRDESGCVDDSQCSTDHEEASDLDESAFMDRLSG